VEKKTRTHRKKSMNHKTRIKMRWDEYMKNLGEQRPTKGRERCDHLFLLPPILTKCYPLAVQMLEILPNLPLLIMLRCLLRCPCN
jgi:hypothetical protein